jgi:hypothetical protein
VRNNSINVLEVIVVSMLSITVIYFSGQFFVSRQIAFPEIIEQIVAPLISPSASPTPPKPPKVLTYAEMNGLYGPCVNLPVLMYHHVEPSRGRKEQEDRAERATRNV